MLELYAMRHRYPDGASRHPAMQFMDVMVACPDRATAETTARTLLQEPLAVCANIGTAIRMIFLVSSGQRWSE